MSNQLNNNIFSLNPEIEYINQASKLDTFRVYNSNLNNAVNRRITVEC
jgi:hypothetical protein